MEVGRVDPEHDLTPLRSFLSESDPHDYLLDGIEEWIRREGLWVGREAGERVAFCRLEDLGDGQAWVGGVRVRATLRGRGLGRRFLAAVIAAAESEGVREFRAVIEDENLASRRLFQRAAFEPLLALTLRVGDTDLPGPSLLARAPAVARFRGPLEWVTGASGRIDLLSGAEGGRFGRWNPAVVERWAREGKLFVGPGLAAGVVTHWQDDPPVMWAVPLQGEPTSLLPALASLGRELGQSSWQAFLPSTEPLRQEYRRLGLRPHALWGDRVHLYERAGARPPSLAASE